jgi:hypothetical protein
MTAIHTHRYTASLYILSWSDFIRYDDKGNILLDSRTITKTPDSYNALWSVSLPPHSLKNIGTKNLHVVSVEIKI